MISSCYDHLLRIETNEIEKVFALGGKSLPRLVKVGFYDGAIDYIRPGGVQETKGGSPEKFSTLGRKNKIRRVRPTHPNMVII